MACLNCGTEFSSTDNYCSTCGQDTATKRLETKHVLHHFFHAFTHTDRGFFHLIPQLLTKPGIVSREYNQGKRKSYFSPFTFVLIIVAISTVLVSTFNIMSVPYRPDQAPAVTMVTNFTNKHFNLMVFFSVPLIAFFTSRFFKKKINFAESLVVVSYTSGERSIFFILVVIPLVLLFKEHYYLVIYSYLALFMSYYAWTCCQYFDEYRIGIFLKGCLCFILSQLAVSFIIAATIFVIIFSAKLFDKIPV